MAEMDRRAGREAFGADPAGYHRARPAYPDWVFDLLAERCGLQPGCAAFEVGPGTGLATQELLRRGADPLVVIEPDPRLADFLAGRLPHSAIDVRRAPFEAAQLEPAAFDLGCAFTSFHWLDPEPTLERAAAALKPGGAWAMVWNVFGDPARPDPFHDATLEIMRTPEQSPSAGVIGRPAFALDAELRTLDLAAAGFTDIATARTDWSLELDPDGVRRLYATYSEVAALMPAHRARMLDALASVADHQFGGRVTRNMVTIAYTARRP
ncbi:bifunctional 2-polyprenyl-6-hydroxyphenol methylase/3-demethylubiquinol 3-O-methyltransferase UbiG [uncultured Phenylobacterium sp.]|uniref:class I SAM-dependent methyltransferase n=1 Tax=uncultured Phenylobacterium sp. TaxID=349273 RepID=UPI0025DBB8AF|nr:class I SAM-dependent methyltransferase [uncultured Phenylobacterium sp.]